MDDLFFYPLPFWEICLKLFANIQQGYLNLSMQSPAAVGCCVAVATLVGYLIIVPAWYEDFVIDKLACPARVYLRDVICLSCSNQYCELMIFATLIKVFRQATRSATHIAESIAVVCSGHNVAPSKTRVFLQNFWLNDCSCIPYLFCFVLPCVSICFESTISTSSYLRPTCRSVWLCVFPVLKSSKTTIQLGETRDYNCISSYGPWFWFVWFSATCGFVGFVGKESTKYVPVTWKILEFSRNARGKWVA